MAAVREESGKVVVMYIVAVHMKWCVLFSRMCTCSLHACVSFLCVHIIRELDDRSYHKISDETLDELAAFFEDLGDSGLCSKDYDASLAVSSV